MILMLLAGMASQGYRVIERAIIQEEIPYHPRTNLEPGHDGFGIDPDRQTEACYEWSNNGSQVHCGQAAV